MLLPQDAQRLVEHLSPGNASKQGVTIQSEAVVNDAHTLYLIAEADRQDQVEGFMAPFAQVGFVEVMAAFTSAAVIARGGCAGAA